MSIYDVRIATSEDIRADKFCTLCGDINPTFIIGDIPYMDSSTVMMCKVCALRNAQLIPALIQKHFPVPIGT